MSSTIRTIKDRVLTELSMLGGVDTQLYAEDKMAASIQRAYDMLFKERYWYFTTEIFTVNLDVATGLPTTNMTTILPHGSFVDIQYVWRPNEVTPLPRIPSNFNPAFVRRFGILPVSDPTKQFRILPVGDSVVTISARVKPADFSDDATVVNFDELCIVMAVCYDILNGTGTNPAEEDKFASLYGKRLGQLTKDEDQHDHYAGGFGASYASDWQEVY